MKFKRYLPKRPQSCAKEQARADDSVITLGQTISVLGQSFICLIKRRVLRIAVGKSSGNSKAKNKLINPK